MVKLVTTSLCETLKNKNRLNSSNEELETEGYLSRTFAIPQIRQIPNVDEFQQDGALPHWSLNIMDYLDATFPDAWIGRGGPTAWPARSPDFTPLDFFCGVTSRTESIRLLSMTWTT